MSYIQDSLSENEKIIYWAHFNWLWKARAWAALAILLAGAAFAYHLDRHQVAIALAALGVLAFVALMLPIWTKEIAITNQRLIYKRGIIARSTKEVQLRAVEEASLNQDVMGRVFGYGTISVHGTGGEDLSLPPLADPVEIRRILEGAMAKVGHVVGAGKL